MFPYPRWKTNTGLSLRGSWRAPYNAGDTAGFFPITRRSNYSWMVFLSQPTTSTGFQLWTCGFSSPVLYRQRLDSNLAESSRSKSSPMLRSSQITPKQFNQWRLVILLVIDLLPTNITEHKVKDLQYITSESMQLSTARLDIKVELRRAAKKKMNNLGPKCWTTFHVCISTAPKREAKANLGCSSKV